ncbi:dihydrolipoamide acetyltransferase family protein [Phytoactinopolyspora limicola]|uniref:dihydrolipoamide acetyltransferase family protein n=1 Tax=Phytoactinopolyspora limicola TaxID=2715536 RepID=UPI001407CD49|nr:dihydrolipoamide acetyltransferase family protein [Phytoactinopolyspora limicola]
MATLLRLPAVAAGSTEAVLQDWSVNEHQAFTALDVIATVETDKALVEVEAEADGVVLKTLVPAGSVVEVGAPIAVLGEPGEQVDDLNTLLADLGVDIDRPARAAERRDLTEPAPEPAAAPDGATSTAAPPATNGSDPEPEDPGNRRIFSSPLARRLAREAGLSLDDITGTGPRGRIVRRDVESAITQRQVLDAPQAPPDPAAGTSSSTTSDAPGPEVEASTSAPRDQPASTRVPHSRIRRATATRLAESKREAPHFYVRASARVDELITLRTRLNEVSSVRISLNDLVIKAVAVAHSRVPEMNVIWTPDAVETFSATDVAVAVATDRGLVTPVLRGVDTMSVGAIAAASRDVTERARAGTLRQDELTGGTITVTNLGMYGVEEFSAIINPPQSAILAVGAARSEPVVDDGKLSVGTVMRVTASVDHRPLDGVVAARWLQVLVATLENPLTLVAH